MLKVDLHLHTGEDPVDILSYDAAALVDRAAALGFQALAITLHERQLVDPVLTGRARDRGIGLLPGIERTIEGRHVLLLNFPAGAAESASTFADVARLRARGNGLVIAPHPFFPGSRCLGADLDRHADLFDAVEWSYFWTRGANFNARAAAWARAHGLPIVGNSDLHDLRQFGRTYSLIDAPADADAICDAIRRGRVSLVTEPVPPPQLAAVLLGMFMRGRRRRDLASVQSAVVER
ncbi:MAG: PHP-associated domain-containing protein [Vicinamibacterales bacterium]